MARIGSLLLLHLYWRWRGTLKFPGVGDLPQEVNAHATPVGTRSWSHGNVFGTIGLTNAIFRDGHTAQVVDDGLVSVRPSNETILTSFGHWIKLQFGKRKWG